VIRVQAAPPEHYPWIAERAKLTIGPSFRAIEAVDGDRILGMVGYDAWMPNSVAMHVAIDEPIAVRHLLKPAFGLPFLHYGKGVIVGTVLSTNEKALAFDKNLGFREVGRITDGWAVGVDLVFLEMRREECRFIDQQRKAA
jgi:hypothetical protein